MYKKLETSLVALHGMIKDQKVENTGKRLSIIRKRAMYANGYIELAGANDEHSAALIDEGHGIMLEYLLDMKDRSLVQKESLLVKLSESSSDKNFKLFFFQNLKLAQVRIKIAKGS